MTRRSDWARRLDRPLTLLMRLGGRVFGRPDEGLLHGLTGRLKGGPEGATSSYASDLAAGRRAVETGQFGEALHHFAKAAEARPGEAWPWHGRGDALQLSGQHAEALAAYDAAVERVPGLGLAHNGRGNALEALGRLDEARAAWERALELDPRLSWPAKSLARVRAED